MYYHLPVFHSWGNWGFQRLSHLSKVTQLLRGGLEIHCQTSWFQRPEFLTTSGKNLGSWWHCWESTNPKVTSPRNHRFQWCMTLLDYWSQSETSFLFFAGETIPADAVRKNITKVKSRKEMQAMSLLDQLPFVLAQENKSFLSLDTSSLYKFFPFKGIMK